MVVTFDSCLILNVRFANSKAGNPYCQLSFLSHNDLSVFDVMVFGDAVGVAAGLAKGDVVQLGFELQPDRNGGVRLELVEVGRVSEM